jgi:hypothetical protein
MVGNFGMLDGKKYMWDGVTYGSEREADGRKDEYGQSGFETLLLPEDGKFLLNTRRVVTGMVIEGAPPL